jgi:diphthamide biosynthesis protein 2
MFLGSLLVHWVLVCRPVKLLCSACIGLRLTLYSLGSYLPLISHIRKLLSKSRKKSYTISVGKINPSKLANFMEIECFILVACPENSLIDAKVSHLWSSSVRWLSNCSSCLGIKDFLRPIITPYELEIALKAEQSWTGQYVLDFEKLLSNHASDIPSGRIPHVFFWMRLESIETWYSLQKLHPRAMKILTNRYFLWLLGNTGMPNDTVAVCIVVASIICAHLSFVEASAGESDGLGSSTLALRNQDSAMSKLSDSAAGLLGPLKIISLYLSRSFVGEFLVSRSYQGLETRLGEDKPSVLEQGRSGIARGYQDDRREDAG